MSEKRDGGLNRKLSDVERLNRELLDLIQHVEGVRDDEKKRLAREIHDQLGQELTAQKLGLYWIKRELEKSSDPSATSATVIEKVLAKLDEMIDLNSGTIHTVRNIAHQMRPVVLDEMGLVPALESLVRDFNKQGGMLCGLRIAEDFEALPPALETDLFRIAQEALTNVGRHAQGHHAYLQLTRTGNEVLLEIGDDGVGYLADQRGFGLGLIGIRERIRAHGGEVEIDSTPGRGTSIRIRMHLSS